MHAPETVVSNADLERLMETSDEWIRTRTGVVERRIAEPGVGTSDLAAEAGKAAIADAGLQPSDIDMLVVATMTPDFYAPGSAPLAQDLIGLGTIPAYGIRQQCSGFLYGLDLADSMLLAGKADRVLVIGAEVHTGIQPWAEDWRALQNGARPSPERKERNDRYRGWGVLFGDGAGAAVLERHDGYEAGLLGTRLHTDGSMFGLIHVPALGSKSQPYVDPAEVAQDTHMPQMEGPQLYRQAVRRMPEVVRDLLGRQDVDVADLDLLIVHQANARIVDGVRRALGLEVDKVPMNLDRYGNTTAGTLPILFHEMREMGRVHPGALVCFVTYGAGAHWGAALYREPR